MSTRRRSPGEGGAYPYQTKAGERHRVKGMVRLPDGTLKEVNKRGFLTRKDALAWLQDAQSAGRRGEFVEPSRQKLGAYGLEVIESLRIGPQTRASYVKNWRNHIQPYPVAAMPLAHLTGSKLTSHYRAVEKSGRRDHREGEGLSPRTVRWRARGASAWWSTTSGWKSLKTSSRAASRMSRSYSLMAGS